MGVSFAATKRELWTKQLYTVSTITNTVIALIIITVIDYQTSTREPNEYLMLTPDYLVSAESLYIYGIIADKYIHFRVCPELNSVNFVSQRCVHASVGGPIEGLRASARSP